MPFSDGTDSGFITKVISACNQCRIKYLCINKVFQRCFNPKQQDFDSCTDECTVHFGFYNIFVLDYGCEIVT